jgi:PAS domain S-box-containing protein
LANLGSWVWDIRRNSLSWSEQIFEIYGVGPVDFRGTYDDFIGRIHPDDRGIVHDAIATALRSGKAFQLSERIVRPDGEVRHLQSVGEVIRDASGEAVRMLGICQDITDRKIAENALRESEERYRLLVDGVHDYAILMLDPAGRIMSWNAGAARIYRYTEDEILGRDFSCFYTEEELDSGAHEKALRAAAAGKFEYEGWRVRKDGSQFWASVLIDAIRAADGSLVGFAKVTRDITERRETQAALEVAREKLAQAQKLEALGQLTGGIAHDFNNLLMIVSGHAQQLRRLVTSPKQLRAIDAIDTATSRGESLTRHLLAFSRNQQLSPAVVDLKARVEAMCGMLISSLRGNIELRCDIPDGIWPTEVDISEFELALVNVAVNARDAMPDGGRFTVSARNVSLTPGQSPGGLDGDFVELSMADTGIGIPRIALAKVFEPFFTTKAVGKGTGLGLSQVHGFAHQSGGTVTIASEVGRGTTIAIYLPRSHAPITSMAQHVQPQPSANGYGTVLVVEDNPEVADVTAALLVQLGYRVTHATQATEALSLLEQGDIDLVFSDIVMPGPMDGVALAGAIRARYPRVPVILTTGYTELAPNAESELLILRKPFQLAALEKVVREALHRASQDNATRAMG